jgi:hypothetical protein
VFYTASWNVFASWLNALLQLKFPLFFFPLLWIGSTFCADYFSILVYLKKLFPSDPVFKYYQNSVLLAVFGLAMIPTNPRQVLIFLPLSVGWMGMVIHMPFCLNFSGEVIPTSGTSETKMFQLWCTPSAFFTAEYNESKRLEVNFLAMLERLAGG